MIKLLGSKLRFYPSILAFVIATILISPTAVAQTKTSLQVKTFDRELKPLPNIEIAINDLDFFKTGPKGTAIIEINQSEIPIKAVRINDEHLEAASWNLSKGTVEIIVRPVSYKIMHVTARFEDGTALANTRVKFQGSKTIDVTSDHSGKFDLPVSFNETIHSKSQFEIANLLVSDMKINGDLVTLTLERLKPKQSPQQSTAAIKPVEPEFDVARLDRLVADSIRASQPAFIKHISDTSVVVEDIRNLLKQATAEHNMLRTNREEFENKIVIISSKLQRGVVNLSNTERNSLLHDIDMLEQLLTDNESQFYKNQNDYREIINTLREKYLEVETLQNRLSATERLREEENREFRQRLLGIGLVVMAFGFLIILLITFSTRLRRQAKSLQNANDQIAQINENLEMIVTKRTRALEETNKELDTFLYRASHDLRSPVRSMLGLVQIINYISRDEMIDHVQLATYNMSRVINKLVDISEIPQEAKNIKTVNILDTINKAHAQHLVILSEPESSGDRGSLMRKRDIQFDVDCPGDLEMHTSPSLLEIIVTNLVENAVFFGCLKKSDVAVNVEIKARIDDNNLVLSVYDDGIGIADGVRPGIFTMFFTGNEKSRGSGLGLYAVRKCVTALQGTVTYESEDGKFTRFTIIIPSKT
jgi:signal transduction histidine kinase